jgi:GntR family transcriptional repressor for pyruvate dehydrogenase complex
VRSGGQGFAFQQPPGIGPVISVDSTTASDNTAAWLKALVFTGQLGPGDRLPAERDLAIQLGIGRMTLRLALKSLETAGYIVTTRGAHGGSRVANVNALSAAWHDWIRRNALQVKQIFELRMILETQVASFAAQRATPDDIRAIEVTLEDAGPTEESLIRWHTAFHDALGAATHNDRLQRAVRELGSEIFLPVAQVQDEPLLVEIRALHQGILDAVRGGDAARAERLMREHLEYTQRTFFRAG